MFYKNISYSEKTYYGVTFKPGETKEVKDFINHKLMIRVDDPVINSSDKQQKPSPEQPKKETQKEQPKKEQPKQVVKTESKESDS